MLPTIDQPVTEGSLTKAALVEQVAHVAGLTKKRAEIIVDTVFGNIAEALQLGVCAAEKADPNMKWIMMFITTTGSGRSCRKSSHGADS